MTRHLKFVLLIPIFFGIAIDGNTIVGNAAESVAVSPLVTSVLERAGDNRAQLEKAWTDVPAGERESLEFLLSNMPDADCRSLTAEFLLEHVHYAHLARENATWKSRVPKDVFLSDVLPYANINERRDRWRKDFYERFGGLVKDAESPSKAAAILNQKIFPTLKVVYSTKRTKADQSPYESIESGLASCTGLSILLIDACRAVGVPARFVGTPLWADKSGNHSWVEVWDNGWNYTGAAEPSGDRLNEVWFKDRASKAVRDDFRHAIYAVSFMRTPTRFPMVWAPDNESVFAVNVTDRYTQSVTPIPSGHRQVMFRTLDANSHDRVTAKLKLTNQQGTVVFEGQTKDERFDRNDHLVAVVNEMDQFVVEAESAGRVAAAKFDGKATEALVTLEISPFQVSESADQIVIETAALSAAVRKKGYVSGIAAQSFVDKKTGFKDLGFGLDIVDWIMEPGSDEAYRDQLPEEMVYRVNNSYHGKTLKRSIEGPQICTKAKELQPKVIRGKDFVAVEQSFRYLTAAPGHKMGSTWTQRIVFPAGKRYFISSDRIDAVNSSDAMFLRVDLPGHIKHDKGNTFSQIYLSYLGQTTDSREVKDGFAKGLIPSSEFLSDFAPDDRFNYRREKATEMPTRMIRAYQLRDPATGKSGPWLAGMTLDSSAVSDAWCHQRGYVCMIEEFGGRPVKAGEHFQAAFIVGYFDSIEEMHRVYDEHAGKTGLDVSESGWKLVR